jgi:hypothetical protein
MAEDFPASPEEFMEEDGPEATSPGRLQPQEQRMAHLDL